jgi:chromosome segregation ATPase
MKKVIEMREDYRKLRGGVGASTSNGNLIKQKKELTDTFNECMSQFDTQRNALIAKTDEAVAEKQMQIDSAQSSIDNANQMLSSLQAQEQQQKQDDATELSNEAQTVNQKMARAQERMKSLADTASKKSQALNEKQQYYQKKSSTLSNAIANLGPVPEDESSTMKLSEVQGKYAAWLEAVNEAKGVIALDKDGKAIIDKNGEPQRCNIDFSIGEDAASSKRARGSRAGKGKG